MNTAAQFAHICISAAMIFISSVSERVVRLGGVTKTEEIKNTAAEMQMRASSAAMF